MPRKPDPTLPDMAPVHVHGPDCQHDHHDHGPLAETYRRETPKVGRNDPCSCGSGKKYKKCHGANA